MFNELVEAQRKFFLSGYTLNVQSRKEALRRLKSEVKKNERAIIEALRLDLGKPEFEAYVSEIAHFYMEVDHILSNIDSWTKKQRKPTPVINMPASSYTIRQPYGVVLIISPWNYPFNLAMVPLAYAITGGNTAILKPSEISEHTSRILNRIVSEVFDENYVKVIEGGADVANDLLNNKFDLIFYTGNPRVGRLVMKKASRNLTPVVLELGGKSPVVVWEKKNLDIATKRIAWAKCFNAGQTCIAPDYVIIEKGYLDRFVESFSKWIGKFYGSRLGESKDYARIVNHRHFDRLRKIIEAERDNILYGGGMDENSLFIEPTLIRANDDSPSMEDEIFGPILPVLEKENVEEVVSSINRKNEPLSIYLFTDSKSIEKYFLERTRSGAIIFGDCLVHFVSPWLPFGGIGESGMGKYHGKWGFECFTNEKAVMVRPGWPDIPIRYPPYSTWKLRLVKFVSRFLNFGI